MSSVPGAAAGETASAELGRKHYQLLRQYWHAGASGLCSRGSPLALELAAAGLLQLKEAVGPLQLMITQAGITEILAETERERQRAAPHNDFASRLAEWQRTDGRMTWENREFRVAWPDGSRKAFRPDLYSIKATLDEAKINPLVFEVKASRADFLADVARPEKRAGYLAIAESMYYAAPAGLIMPGEVPAECGLVVEVSLGRFEVVKRVKRRPVVLPASVYLNLILKPGMINPL
jgi:hypothetical protein